MRCPVFYLLPLALWLSGDFTPPETEKFNYDRALLRLLDGQWPPLKPERVFAVAPMPRVKESYVQRK